MADPNNDLTDEELLAVVASGDSAMLRRLTPTEKTRINTLVRGRLGGPSEMPQAEGLTDAERILAHQGLPIYRMAPRDEAAITAGESRSSLERMAHPQTWSDIGQLMLAPTDTTRSILANASVVLPQVGRGASAAGRGLEQLAEYLPAKYTVPGALGGALAGHPQTAAIALTAGPGLRLAGRGLQMVGRMLGDVPPEAIQAAGPTAEAAAPAAAGSFETPLELTRRLKAENLAQYAGQAAPEAEPAAEVAQTVAKTARATRASRIAKAATSAAETAPAAPPPAAPSGLAPAPAATISRQTAQAMKWLKQAGLSDAEVQGAMRWLQEGVSPAEIVKRLEATRALRQTGTFAALPTDAQVAASVAARNATGRWPD